MIGESKELCDRAGMPCSVFSDVQGNPVEQNVIDGVEAYKTNGCDGVIAFVRIFFCFSHSHLFNPLLTHLFHRVEEARWTRQRRLHSWSDRHVRCGILRIVRIGTPE